MDFHRNPESPDNGQSLEKEGGMGGFGACPMSLVERTRSSNYPERHQTLKTQHADKSGPLRGLHDKRAATQPKAAANMGPGVYAPGNICNGQLHCGQHRSKGSGPG